MANKFIQIGGKRFTVDELRAEAKKEALKANISRVNDAARAIQLELQAIVDEMNANTSKRNDAYLKAMGNRTVPAPAAANLYVDVQRSGIGANARISIRVLDRSKGEDNAFNKLDAGTKPRLVPPGKAVVFPRYEGHSISTGKQRPISISIGAVRYGRDVDPDHPLVKLFGKNRRFKSGFRIAGIEPRNLYNRTLITLRNSGKKFYNINGSNGSWVIRFVARTAATFASDNLVIKVKTS